MFRFFSVFFSVLMMASSFAYAAGEVTLRAHDDGERVRLVVEWPMGAAPSHSVRKIDDQTVEVSFADRAEIEPFLPSKNIPEIVSVRRVSEPGSPLKLWVIQSKPLFKRDLAVGRRVMLDFALDPQARKEATAASVRDVPKAIPVVSKPKEVASVIKAVPPVPVKAEPIADALQPNSAPKVLPAPSRMIVDSVQPPVLTLAALQKVGVAAFIYSGYLWAVMDTPNFEGVPKLSGKGADQLGRPKRVGTSDATVFKWKLPGDVSDIRGEGGDLLWRVVFAPEDMKQNPVTPFERLEEKGLRAVLWPSGVTKVVRVADPDSGTDLFVGTVGKSNQYSGPGRRFAEFDAVRSVIGLALVPKVDDLTVRSARGGVLISRPSGMSVTSTLQARTYRPEPVAPMVDVDTKINPDSLAQPPTQAQSEHEVQAVVAPSTLTGPGGIVDATGKSSNVLYRFDRWAMGGVPALLPNETALVSDLSERKPEDRASGFVSIGKMFLSNGRGGEAVGYLRLALESAPGLIDSPEFLGVRGAAYAVNGQYDLALQDLTNPGLDVYSDVPMWRAVSLGKLQDWDQAAAVPNVNPAYALQYPWAFGPDMALTVAEIALRSGKPTEAQKILTAAQPVVTNKVALKEDDPIHRGSIQAYNDYLNGELARQQGKKDVARGLWKKLAKSKDDKYRARARLALTVLDYEEGKLPSDKAIDQLESMRFSWRGDDFEMAIGMRLGQTYLAGGDYIRGLTFLRDTVSLAPDTEMGRRITAEMTDQFRTLFTPENMKKIDPVDAITVFEKFGELAPVGVDANQMMMNLVDRCMELDLLDRATRILQELVDHKLVDGERVDGALRLAAVHLMNKRPDLALGVLNRAEAMVETLADNAETREKSVRLGLLRARALSQSDRVDQAMAVLAELPQDHADVVRLMADIAWQTARWTDAAQAISKLLSLDPPALGKNPTDAQAESILNLAVAINLSGDRIALAKIRDEYGVGMAQTAKAGEFDVVTRARQVATLADRDTLGKLVNEVDLFGKFLDTFKKSTAVPSGTQGAGDASPQVNAGSVEADATEAQVNPPSATDTTPASAGATGSVPGE